MIEILAWDWDEVLMLAMGFAGFAYIVADLKRERRLDEVAMNHEGRLSSLEANHDDSIALEVRLRDVENRVENNERLDERIAALGERVAVLETRAEGSDDEG